MTNCIHISEKIKAWTQYVPFDGKALEQIHNIASLPIIYKHVAIMPDVHVGKGATIGSVIPAKNAVIPSAVGVDIGCGMMAVRIGLSAHHLPDNLHYIRTAIEQAIPVGFNKWPDNHIPRSAILQWERFLGHGYQKILARHPRIGCKKNTHKRMMNDINQLGTLGGGNHFIEICLDENNQIWLMLHSGSRGVGNCIGTYFIDLAKKDMGTLLGTLPDSDLAYLSKGTQHFDDYFFAVSWAQKYARINRDLMMQSLTDILSRILKQPVMTDLYAVNCHHNYVNLEQHFGENIYVTRKGAVSAKKDEYGIIPGSMGSQSFIVQGLGNELSFNSCSHGAGRIMSRRQAKKLINLNEHCEATQNVECRKDHGVLDESPKAYKNISDVMKSQQDLVKIVFTLKQILCVKG